MLVYNKQIYHLKQIYTCISVGKRHSLVEFQASLNTSCVNRKVPFEKLKFTLCLQNVKFHFIVKRN